MSKSTDFFDFNVSHIRVSGRFNRSRIERKLNPKGSSERGEKPRRRSRGCGCVQRKPSHVRRTWKAKIWTLVLRFFFRVFENWCFSQDLDFCCQVLRKAPPSNHWCLGHPQWQNSLQKILQWPTTRYLISSFQFSFSIYWSVCVHPILFSHLPKTGLNGFDFLHYTNYS